MALAAQLRYGRLLGFYPASFTMEVRGRLASGQQLSRSNACDLPRHLQGFVCQCVGLLASTRVLRSWHHAGQVEDVFTWSENPKPSGEVIWWHYAIFPKLGLRYSYIYFPWKLFWNVLELAWNHFPTTKDCPYFQMLHVGKHWFGKGQSVPWNGKLLQGSLHEGCLLVFHKNGHPASRRTPAWSRAWI